MRQLLEDEGVLRTSEPEGGSDHRILKMRTPTKKNAFGSASRRSNTSSTRSEQSDDMGVSKGDTDDESGENRSVSGRRGSGGGKNCMETSGAKETSHGVAFRTANARRRRKV